MEKLLIERFRKKVKNLISLSSFESALFWSDKIVTLSDYQLEDTYYLVHLMFILKHYQRVIKLIESKNLHQKHIIFKYYISKCYYETKHYKRTMEHLLDINRHDTSSNFESFCCLQEEEIIANMFLLKGDICCHFNFTSLACENFCEALSTDVYCYEAYNRLIDNHLLKPEEESQLVASFNFSKDHCKDEEEVVRFLYNIRSRRHKEEEIPQNFIKLENNLDVKLYSANQYFINFQFTKSFEIIQEVAKKDPFNNFSLPLHVALLVQFKKTNQLFTLAHQLVDNYPHLPISWFAVGCFYFIQNNKHDLALQYFNKSILVNDGYGPAVLAIGHLYAKSNYHDKAQAAYLRASRLMPGSYLPSLYIGSEYNFNNLPKLATKFFNIAQKLSPKNPYVLNEIGVMLIKKEDYHKALHYFKFALSQVEEGKNEVDMCEWEPLVNNLAHTYRKLGDFDKSIHYHTLAITLSPTSFQNYSNIALSYCYIGDFENAIKALHKSLSLHHKNSVASSLLQFVMNQRCFE